MRIISGEYKGRILSSVNKAKIRPSSDKVKGSIFNVLKGEVSGRKVLDLFAGSGNLGIEALSGGAEFATFVDSSLQSIKIIKKNLGSLNLDQRAKTIGKDCLRALPKLQGKFGVIFADPPYLCDFAQKVIDSVVKYDLLEKDGILVLEHHKKETLKCPEEKLLYIKAKRFGDTMVSFFIKKSETACPTLEP
ncbi:MAG: 16S rRNA (guanine(966)-N(2))-methyltransferase RsmD [candidate division Zixibacteria bacterium]|nr:16S rRNA (guanine(966)-N(2))-methyltransferase RsmD [candidate division Zixibacteria bacterium]